MAGKRGSDAKLRIAVLDLGSTSFHLLVADASPTGAIERVVRRRSRLRLGATISQSAEIPHWAAERAVDTAVQLQRLAEESGAERLIAVATAALRDASNGHPLASDLSDALGVRVRVLSGEQEARLIFSAFRHRVPFGDAPALGLDLGGGSLELAIGDGFEVHWETTLPLGAARLHAELVRKDPMKRSERKAIRRRVRAALVPHREVLRTRAPRSAIASGGTARALANLRIARGKGGRASHPMRLNRPALSKLARRLFLADLDQRMEMRGMKRSRADLLPTGALVLETLADELELEHLLVCDWGLREGVILEALGLVSCGD